MQSRNRATRLGLLLALGVCIQYLENNLWFPVPVLGIKPGCANLVILVAIYCMTLRDAAVLALLRPLFGSMLCGTFFGPAMLMSIAGAVSSLLGMYLCRKYVRMASAVGVSVTGAAGHITAQFIVASLIVGSTALLSYLPITGNLALITGLISGYALRYSLPVIQKTAFGMKE